MCIRDSTDTVIVDVEHPSAGISLGSAVMYIVGGVPFGGDGGTGATGVTEATSSIETTAKIKTPPSCAIVPVTLPLLHQTAL